MNIGTIPDAARELNISRSKAYDLARTGDLPGTFRLEGTTIVRVDLDALAAWVRERGSASEAVPA